MINDMINIGETSTCPVCGVTFKITKEHCGFISGGCACSWKCFFDEVKRRDSEKKVRTKEKKNGH